MISTNINRPALMKLLALLGFILLASLAALLPGMPRVEGAHQDPHVIATIPVGAGPDDIALDANKDQIYINGEDSNTITVIDRSTLAVITSIITDAQPDSFRVHSSLNRVYLTNEDAASVSIIDTSTHQKITDVTVGRNPQQFRLHEPLNRLYTGNSDDDTVSIIDATTTTNSLIATVDVGDRPSSLRVNPNTHRVYVANEASDDVSIIDGAINSNTVIATIPVGDNPRDLRLSTNLDRAYVANQDSGTVSIIDGAATDSFITNVTVGTRPIDMEVDNNTNRVYVANKGSDTVSVIDGSTNTDSLFTTIQVGPEPENIRMNTNINRAYVTNSGGNTLSVIDTTNSTLVTNVPVCNGPVDLGINRTTNAVYVACPFAGEEAISIIDGNTNNVITTIPFAFGSEPEISLVDRGFDRVFVPHFGEASVSVIGEPPPPPDQSASISGGVFEDASGPGNAIIGARVEVCDVNSCQVFLTGASGQYTATIAPGLVTLRAFPPGGGTLLSSTIGPLNLSDGDVVNRDFILTLPVPIDTVVGVSPLRNPGGSTPSVGWSNPTGYTKDVSQHCGVSSPLQVKLVIEITHTGAFLEQMMTNTEGEIWEATFPPFSPHHGPALLTFFVDCPADTPGFPEDVSIISVEDETQIGGHIYIDPSGSVVDSNNNPISGATVTLLHSDSPGGSFDVVPDGSGVMSPSNRSNPDTTNPDGSFGWDVIAGFYTVRAEADGCVSPDDPSQSFVETSVLTIPPPVTDLVLVLDCTPQTLTVDIDINPGSAPNSISCNNPTELITVAVLTTDMFDATTVDPTTVVFSGASQKHFNEEDVEEDGDTDLVLHFGLDETTLTCNSLEATIFGETFDGQVIVGTDAVLMVDNQPPTADAGPDQNTAATGNSGAEVMLDGTGSSDPDNDLLSYSWSAPGIVFDDSTSPTPTATFPVGTTPVTLVVNDGAVDSAPDTVAITVGMAELGPRDLKQGAIDKLALHVDESQRFEKAIKDIEKSLDPKLWATIPPEGSANIDPSHLDSKHGKKVFDHERHAVKELMYLLKGVADDKCEGVSAITLEYTGPGTITVEAVLKKTSLGTFAVSTDDPTFEVAATAETGGKLHSEIRLVVDDAEVAKIHTSCSKPIDIGDVHGDFTIDNLDKLPPKDGDKPQVSEEALEWAQMAIDDLVNADRILAQVLVEENSGLVAVNPERQDKVEKELQKAADEVAKGDDDRDALKPDDAIQHYRKAWEHAIKAMKEQMLLPGDEEEEEDEDEGDEKDNKDGVKEAGKNNR